MKGLIKLNENMLDFYLNFLYYIHYNIDKDWESERERV